MLVVFCKMDDRVYIKLIFKYSLSKEAACLKSQNFHSIHIKVYVSEQVKFFFLLKTLGK